MVELVKVPPYAIALAGRRVDQFIRYGQLVDYRLTDLLRSAYLQGIHDALTALDDADAPSAGNEDK